MPAKNTKAINLLPQEEFAQTTAGRVLTWLLSTFRFIVIVTEVIVMGAFLSRFWLDARNADLNDLISQKRAILGAFADFEKTFRNDQKKLAIFSTLTVGSGDVSEKLSLAASYLPPDVSLDTFAVNSGEIQLGGFSANEASIAQYIANLDGSSLFSKVAVTRVSSAEEDPNILVFTLKLTPKGGGV